MSCPALPSRKLVRALEQAAASIGAKLAWDDGGKHAKAIATLPDGKRVHLTISRGTAKDPVHLQRFFQQQVRRVQAGRRR